MVIGQDDLIVDVVAGSAFSLLAALAAASPATAEAVEPDLRAALEDVGDSKGESWLNLFGVVLDAGPPYAVERLVDALGTLEPVELRRHLLGRYAWSWCTLGGIDDIEAAAAGDAGAAGRLLAHPRYYAGHARESLGTLVALDPAETQRRIVAAVTIAAASLVTASEQDDLEAAAASARATTASIPARAAIEELTGGFRYLPEPEAERVFLIPHLQPRLPLVLAQHRSSRLIAYRAVADRSREERLVILGRALADPRRVEILALVGRGTGRAGDLVDATGLTRSTVHHHLAQLRDAGLVALEGNARAYTYVPRRAAAGDTASVLADVLGTEEH